MSCVKKTSVDQSSAIIARIDNLEKQIKIINDTLTLLTKGKKRGPKPKVSLKVSDITYIEDDKAMLKTECDKQYKIMLTVEMIDVILKRLKDNMFYELKDIKLVT